MNGREATGWKKEISVWMSASGRTLNDRSDPSDRTDQRKRKPGPPESQPRQAGLPSGDQSVVEPPGPIPNPEVKRRSADGSETIGLVRVGRRQVYARPRAIGAGLFFLWGRTGIPPVMDDGLPACRFLGGQPDARSALTGGRPVCFSSLLSRLFGAHGRAARAPLEKVRFMRLDAGFREALVHFGLLQAGGQLGEIAGHDAGEVVFVPRHQSSWTPEVG